MHRHDIGRTRAPDRTALDDRRYRNEAWLSHKSAATSFCCRILQRPADVTACADVDSAHSRAGWLRIRELVGDFSNAFDLCDSHTRKRKPLRRRLAGHGPTRLGAPTRPPGRTTSTPWHTLVAVSSSSPPTRFVPTDARSAAGWPLRACECRSQSSCGGRGGWGALGRVPLSRQRSRSEAPLPGRPGGCPFPGRVRPRTRGRRGTHPAR